MLELRRLRFDALGNVALRCVFAQHKARSHSSFEDATFVTADRQSFVGCALAETQRLANGLNGRAVLQTGLAPQRGTYLL